MAADRPSWRCYFCDEVFTTPGGAADHFGATLDDKPGCLIDYQVQVEAGVTTQRGRGLLMELRRVQAELAEVYRQRGEDDTPLQREMYAMENRHQQALRREEEKGYERGLRDGAREAKLAIVGASAKLIDEFAAVIDARVPPGPRADPPDAFNRIGGR